MGTLLDVKNLSYGYTAQEVVKDISFSVQEGGFLGIAGPNGAGKTTLFRIITRVLDPWQGEIVYNGKNMTAYSPKQRAREIAVLSQMFTSTFSYTVEEFVHMGRYAHLGRLQRTSEHDRNVVEESMTETGILEFKNRNMGELSGGELQRVLLAQALAQEPKLLLLDEPTSHLDISHQIEILDLLKKLNREKGLTIIAVLHDLNMVSEYCDQLVLLKSGQIYKHGIPKDVLTYQHIEAVYNTAVIVKENPISKKPHVILIPGRYLEGK